MMNSVAYPDSRPLRGRLAPSPTGALHLGNARSFLTAWLSIRSRGGSVVMRIEDLDHPKVKSESAAQALEDLAWLGLDWDEGPERGGPYGPYVQSKRLDYYREACLRLQQQSLIYPCVCSRKDVEEAQSAPHELGATPRYPGTCRNRFTDYAQARETLPEGRLPAWRIKVPAANIRFEDGFHGVIEENLAETAGDFVLARHADGAGYMLAVVVDDAAMHITEVLRGDDLLDATPRQLLLYDVLGLPPPTFIHVPLVVSTDGRRLAKRHGDTRIRTLREQGIPASQIIGLLAWWSGWGAWGEQFMPKDLLERYRLDAMPCEPVVLDSRVKQYLHIAE